MLSPFYRRENRSSQIKYLERGCTASKALIQDSKPAVTECHKPRGIIIFALVSEQYLYK